MNNTATAIFAFIIGASIGSFVTWKLVKKKYEQIAQEEIDSVKEVFSRRNIQNSNSEEKVEVDNNIENTLTDYKDAIKENGYFNYSEQNKEKEGGIDMSRKPYIISPSEFDELDGYDAVSLTYYADGVLVDDIDDSIIDINIVGKDSLTHFGEYEDDSVFVRNEKLKTDYEILLDVRKYSDVKNDPPYQVNDDDN